MEPKYVEPFDSPQKIIVGCPELTAINKAPRSISDHGNEGYRSKKIITPFFAFTSRFECTIVLGCLAMHNYDSRGKFKTHPLNSCGTFVGSNFACKFRLAEVGFLKAL